MGLFLFFCVKVYIVMFFCIYKISYQMELKELSLPTVAEELRQQSFWRIFLSSKTYVLTPLTPLTS